MTDDLCEACGERNAAASQFCASCGAYLGWDGAARPVETASPATSHSVASTEPADWQPSSAGVARADAEQRGGPVIESGTRCPRCAATNDPQLRFCRKCGQPLSSAVDAIGQGRIARSDGAPAPRVRVWRNRSAERAAQAAYRGSLPMRYRLTRVAAAVAVVGLAVAGLVVVGRNPVGWAQHQLTVLRGSLVPVTGITASTDPAPKPDLASAVLDDRTDTAWMLPTYAEGSNELTCAAGPTVPALVLTLPSVQTLRGLQVWAGLPSSDLIHHWRPRTLELRTRDGLCARIHLQDSTGPQRIRFDKPLKTNQIRLTIVGYYRPEGGADNFAEISELQLLKRPN